MPSKNVSDQGEPEAVPQPVFHEPLKKEEDNGPTVHYVGSSSNRVITQEEWEQAGITDQPTVMWDESNDRTVPLDSLTELAQQRLGNEPGFEIRHPDIL